MPMCEVSDAQKFQRHWLSARWCQSASG